MQRLQANNILGVDISNHQGNADFSGFKAEGVRFVYLKATEGVGYQDSFFLQNVQKAKAAGLPVGAYHFSRHADNTAEAEAESFLNMIKGQDLELCPVLDLEVGYLPPDQLVTWVQTFRSLVEAETQMKLILYTGMGFANTVNGFNNALSDMPLWIANYQTGGLEAVTLPNFGGWADWVIWQYTDQGTLGGVRGHVDLNYARSLEAISQSLKPQFNVFQRQKGKQVLLKSFVEQSDAVAYAKQWAMGSVVRISDNRWIWDNYPKKDDSGK